MKYPLISRTLIEIKEADLALRQKLISEGKLGVGYNEEMRELHKKNARILEDIINRIGYPTIEKVGSEASEATWLLVQHSIDSPSLMKQSLNELEKLANENNFYLNNYIYLLDRVLVLEGKPQIYGTQFDWDENGELSPNKIKDPKKVNERRKSVGLNPIEEQISIIRERARIENQTPPHDLKQRNTEMEAWRKSVGWLTQ